MLILLLACQTDPKPTPADDTGATIDSVADDTGRPPDTGDSGTTPSFVFDGVEIDLGLAAFYTDFVWLPDLDGDGRDALVIGRNGMTEAYCLGAGVPPPSVCLGYQDEDDLRVLDGREGAAFSLETDADRVLAGDGAIGHAVARADVDGDGTPEILALAPMSARGGEGGLDYLTNAGEIGVYAAAATGDATEAALGGWVGEPTRRVLGYLERAGDLDGDGIDEVITYVGGDDNTYSVLPGGSWSAAYPVAPSHPAVGLAYEDALGLGDVDGDGVTDVALAIVTDSDLTLSLWTAGGLDIEAPNADTLAIASGLFTGYTQAAQVAVIDSDGDGYGDVWATPSESNFGRHAVGADGSAAVTGEVLRGSDLVVLSNEDGEVGWVSPTGLGAGEDASLAISFGRSDGSAVGVVKLDGDLLTRGATRTTEDGVLINDRVSYSMAEGSWDGDGVPDLAMAVSGELVELGSGYFAFEQAVRVALDP